jgi:hypothetical protein
MKTAAELVRELRRVQRKMTGPLNEFDRGMAYGAQQTLCWALEQNAMAPARCLLAAPRTKR